MGFVAGCWLSRSHARIWERGAGCSSPCCCCCWPVLVPGIGKVVNGRGAGWIGPIGSSPELASCAPSHHAADYMVRKMDVKERFFRAVLPMGAAVAVVGVLLLAEPDMGAFMVVAVIAMGILFLGGVNARMFFLIAAILVAAFALMIASSPWRRERACLPTWTPSASSTRWARLPALARAHRHWPWRDVWAWPGRQRGKTATGCPRRIPTSCSPSSVRSLALWACSVIVPSG